jgi:hypothetical protein
MAFTYLSTAPASSDRSYVRLRLGDTDIDNHQLDDAEIDALLDTYGNKFLAAAFLAETLGASNASRTDKKVGNLTISHSQTSKHYFDLATRLRYEATSRATVYAGGISVSDKAAVEQDSGRVAPKFSVGQFDNPSSTGED